MDGFIFDEFSFQVAVLDRIFLRKSWDDEAGIGGDGKTG